MWQTQCGRRSVETDKVDGQSGPHVDELSKELKRNAKVAGIRVLQKAVWQGGCA